MNTFDGYIRRDGTNSKVLLDGGDAKALSSFIGTLSYNDNKITYTKADGSTSYDLVDLSNYIYSLVAATSDNLGGIRIGFSQSGKNYPVKLDSNNKAYVYVPWEANTHYTTRLYVGDGTAENKITTNGNTRIAITDDNTVRNYITLIGSGATTVSSDDNGKITINSTNTTYDTGDSATLNTGTNTEGKLWSAKTLVDYISDILGVDSTAITSLNTLVNQLHDNDTATGILVELAKKLNTPSSSIGNNKQPIYWNGSSFATIGYTIEISVPSSAVFTDTKYSFYVGENNNTKEHKNVNNPYFKLFENNTPTSIQIKAGTGISVSSDVNGNITIKNEAPDLNHDTWRPIKIEGTEKLGSATNTDALDLTAGDGIEVSYDSTNKKVIIKNTKPDLNHDTHYTTSMYVGENNDNKVNKAVNSPYFKLFDNDTRRSTLRFVAGTGIGIASDDNGNITITNSSPDQNHNTDKTGIKLGTISGTKKTDSTVIINDSSTGLTIEGGTNKFSIGDGTNYIEVPITPSFTVSNKDATIGTSLTTIATIAGTDIKAKIGSYLPLSGGTMDSGAIIIWKDWGQWGASSPTYPKANGGLQWSGTSDNLKLFAEETNSDDLRLILQCGYDASPQFNIRDSAGTTTVSLHSNGTITGTSIVNSGSSNSYVLLGGGGTKLISDFLTSQYTTGLYIGATEAKSNAATTNGNTYIKLFDSDTRRSNFKISGTQNVSVSSDANGNVTITGPDLSGLAVSGALDNYLPLSGGTLSGYLTVSGASTHAPLIVKGGLSGYRHNIQLIPSRNWSGILFGANDVTTEVSNTTTNSYWVGNNNGAFSIAKGNSGNSSVSLYCDGTDWYVNTKKIYHSGNLPAYPTKNSWNYDDRYVKLSGDNTINGILTISPTNTSAYLDALILHDAGIGRNEGARIRFTSSSYTTGITLYPNSDKSALLIDGNTILTSANISSYAITDSTKFQLNDIQEGAVNHFGQEFTIYQPNTVTKMPDIHGYKATGSARRIYGLGFNGYTIWTVSGYFKADSAITVNINLCDVNSNTSYGENSTSVQLTTEYVYHKFTYTSVTSHNTSSSYNGFLDIEGSSNVMVYAKDLMIEEGYVAHAWRPSITEFLTGTYSTGTWDISITGNATTATKATNDSDGNAINTTYLKKSGGTMSGNISMNNSSSITNLPINGGIYWNSYVESASDGSDAASITLIKSGPAGGTTLVLTQQNDSTDTIQFVTNGSANLYHNSNKIWDAGNDGSGSGLDADLLDGYNENSFFRYRGDLYQNNNHNANTLGIGSWIFRSSGYGKVGSGAAHANALSENSTIEVFQNLQLSTVAWSNSVSYRVRWGNETNSNRPNSWSSWYNFLSNENYTNYTVTKTGSGASGTWGINITGSAGSVAWNNVSGKPSTFTPSTHTHDYLPLSGGTVTGPITINSSVNGSYNEGLRITRAGNSWAGITFGSTGTSGAPTGGWFVATNPSNQFIINPDDSGSTAGLCLNKGGDLKWRNQTVIHSGNIGSQSVSYANSAGNSSEWGGYSRNRMRFPDLGSTMNHIMPLNLAGLKSFGTPLSTDPEFSIDTNLLYVYNNNGNGTVTITRVADAEAANSSGYVCKIVTNGSASPGAGGFHPSLSSYNSAVFLQIFRAKIPVGWQVNTASNSMGSNYSDSWITEQAGTGKWEWYGRLIHCGNSGTHSSGGYVYLTGTSNTSVTWYVSYHQIIDLTKANYDGLRTKYSDSATSAGSATKATQDSDGSQINTTYLKKSGGTMTGVINWGTGSTKEILQFSTNETWKSGLRYSWASSTTVSLWGKHKNTAFVWHAGTDAEINGHGSTTYDFRIRRESDVVVARIAGNIVYHSGNLPAYPTKASWNYDDMYVTSITTSGNYLRWVKNGNNNDITIPYATSSGSCSGNAASATKLQTACTIWGLSFDGSSNVSGAIDGVYERLSFSKENWNYICVPATNGNLSFNVGAAGTAYTKMCVVNSGNVGIGTTNPSYKLHVKGLVKIEDNCPALHIVNNNTNSDTYSIIRFGVNNTENGAYIFLNGPNRTSDGGLNTMTIRNNNGDLRLDNKVTVTKRLYPKEWIEFLQDSGLYFTLTNYNSSYLFPGRSGYGSYGALTVLGSRGGYNGIHFGDGSDGLTIMNINSGHQGLYTESIGQWLIYQYAASNDKRIGIGTSSLVSGYKVTLAGPVCSTSNIYIKNEGGCLYLNKGCIRDANGNWIVGKTDNSTGSVSLGSALVASTVVMNNSGGSLTLNTNGTLTATGTCTATAFYTSSDIRLKNIISDIQYSSEEIASLRSVKYTWKNKNDKVHIGSIAQDAERIIPEVVNVDDKGYKSLDYATLGAIGVISLAREIVELRKEIKELKSKLYG